MDTMTLRELERILIVLSGAMCIYLGYRLFYIATEKQGKMIVEQGKSFTLTLSDVAPGVYFAGLGTTLLVVSMLNNVHRVTDTVTNSAAQPLTGQPAARGTHVDESTFIHVEEATSGPSAEMAFNNVQHWPVKNKADANAKLSYAEYAKGIIENRLGMEGGAKSEEDQKRVKREKLMLNTLMKDIAKMKATSNSNVTLSQPKMH